MFAVAYPAAQPGARAATGPPSAFAISTLVVPVTVPLIAPGTLVEPDDMVILRALKPATALGWGSVLPVYPAAVAPVETLPAASVCAVEVI